MTDDELRALRDRYDTQMEVERNPFGAWGAIQSLAAEITRLRAKVEALAAALEFYAGLSHEGPWSLPGEDYGKRARAALEQNKSET